jgi:hypothetical protein
VLFPDPFSGNFSPDPKEYGGQAVMQKEITFPFHRFVAGSHSVLEKVTQQAAGKGGINTSHCLGITCSSSEDLYTLPVLRLGPDCRILTRRARPDQTRASISPFFVILSKVSSLAPKKTQFRNIHIPLEGDIMPKSSLLKDPHFFQMLASQGIKINRLKTSWSTNRKSFPKHFLLP